MILANTVNQATKAHHKGKGKGGALIQAVRLKEEATPKAQVAAARRSSTTMRHLVAKASRRVDTKVEVATRAPDNSRAIKDMANSNLKAKVMALAVEVKGTDRVVEVKDMDRVAVTRVHKVD